MIHGLHHVALRTRDPETFQAVLAFYETVLGCPLLRRWGTGEGQGAMLDLGNAVLEVFATGGGLGKGDYPHIAFAVDSADDALALACQGGAALLEAPRDADPGGSYPIRVAFCTGLAGEEIEFFQERGACE